MIKISVPARICFYGDHQDYLGLPVIAGAIDRFIHISATPNNNDVFKIVLKDLGRTDRIRLDDSLEHVENGDYFRSVMEVLGKEGLNLVQGYDIEIHSSIPVNAGLSSSSALTVAWIQFLLTTQECPFKWDNKQVGRWAYEAEVLYFNQPGGLMDQYTIAQGGLLYIDTKQGETKSLNANLGKLVVAESGLPKKTLDVLKNGRVYAQSAIDLVKEKCPDFNMDNAKREDYERYKYLIPEKFMAHWYAAVHNYEITLEAKNELLKQQADKKVLGDLMNRHQTILHDQIKNTPTAMMTMMEAAKTAGALGAKTIGSGGGGCMVAMVTEETEDQVIKAFMDRGAKAAYPVNITNTD